MMHEKLVINCFELNLLKLCKHLHILTVSETNERISNHSLKIILSRTNSKTKWKEILFLFMKIFSYICTMKQQI